MSSVNYSQTAIYAVSLDNEYKVGFADSSNDLIVIGYDGKCKKYTLNGVADRQSEKLPDVLNYKLIETIDVCAQS